MTELLHIYAFGSVCRGEVVAGSDIDMLAVCTGGTNALSRSIFSIYSHSKIRKIWAEGNPFAWHLHLESALIYGSDRTDFIRNLGSPKVYAGSREDCGRFLSIYRQALGSLSNDQTSLVFDLSAAFLGLRNFCTCYLLGRGEPNFSRGVALALMEEKTDSDIRAYRVLERARLLCTRGHGAKLSSNEIAQAINVLPKFENWMASLMEGHNNGG